MSAVWRAVTRPESIAIIVLMFVLIGTLIVCLATFNGWQASLCYIYCFFQMAVWTRFCEGLFDKPWNP